MKFSWIICLLVLTKSQMYSQIQVVSDEFEHYALYLRTPKPVVLDSIEMDLPKPGKVWLKLEGSAKISVGDVITFGTHYYPIWQTNDGNTNVYALDSAHLESGFGINRTFDLPKGKSTFYAVAQNWTDKKGDGYADIKGKLTVMYEPVENEEKNFWGKGYHVYPSNIGEMPKIVHKIDGIHANDSLVCLFYEGLHYGVNGDQIAFEMNTDSIFLGNDMNPVVGITSVHQGRYFTSQKCFKSEETDTSIYIMAKKLAGNFATNENGIYAKYIVNYHVNSIEAFESKLSGESHDVAAFSYDAPQKGKLLIRTTGHFKSDGLSRVEMDLTTKPNEEVKGSGLTTQSVNEAYLNEFFSFTHLVDVAQGSNPFYLAGRALGGPDTLSLSGNVTFQFIPEAVVSSTQGHLLARLEASVFPNPGEQMIHINLGETPFAGKVNVNIFDTKGRLFIKTALDYPAENAIDVTPLASGLYYVVLETAEALSSCSYIHK